MAKSRNLADAVRAIIASDPALAEMVDDEAYHAALAKTIYDARTAAGLTQTDLAQLIGTHQAVISRLEDADYLGHSLAMLKKIARALGYELRIEFQVKGTVVSQQ